jgi:hypothetical protein
MPGSQQERLTRSLSWTNRQTETADGAGREILTDDEIAHYHARAAQLAPPGMLTWLHSPGHSRPA